MDSFLSTNNINTLFNELKYFVKSQNDYDLNDKYKTQFKTLCDVLHNKQKEYINSLEDFNSEVRSRIFPYVVNSILNRRKNKFNSNYIENQLNCDNAAGNRIIPQNSSCIPSKTDQYYSNTNNINLKGDNYCKEDSVIINKEKIQFNYDTVDNQNTTLYNNLSNNEKMSYNNSVVNSIINKYSDTPKVTPTPESNNEGFVNYDTEDTFFKNIDSIESLENTNPLGDKQPLETFNTDNTESCELNKTYKTQPKINSLIILDSKPLTADANIENVNCDLANELTVNHVTDVTLEFLSLHNLKTENGLSIENCHNFVLSINADGFNVNTYSNSPNLTGKYVLPNEAFGLQDTETNFQFTVVATTDSDTTITLSAADPKIIAGMKVTGSGIPDNTRVSTVDGTTVTLTAAATTSVTNNLITFTDINTTYKSTIVKLKTNYMCTIGQFVDDINQKFSTFSFTVEGLVVTKSISLKSCK